MHDLQYLHYNISSGTGKSIFTNYFFFFLSFYFLLSFIAIQKTYRNKSINKAAKVGSIQNKQKDGKEKTGKKVILFTQSGKCIG